jgi:uncharacterized membrane protein YjgN (DUF898 family)
MRLKLITVVVAAAAVSFLAGDIISIYSVYDRASALFKTLDNGKAPIPFATLVSEMRGQATLACLVTATVGGIASTVLLIFFRRK